MADKRVRYRKLALKQNAKVPKGYAPSDGNTESTAMFTMEPAPRGASRGHNAGRASSIERVGDTVTVVSSVNGEQVCFPWSQVLWAWPEREVKRAE